LLVQLRVDRSGKGYLTTPDVSERSAIVGVQGTDVLVLYGTRPGEVVGLFWQQDTARYSLLIVQPPPGGLRLDAATEIVADLLGRKEAGP